MKKHASSHGLAVLVCTITAGILVKISRDLYPVGARYLENISKFIIKVLNLDYEPRIISTLILAVILAIMWGIAFSFLHSDKKKDND